MRRLDKYFRKQEKLSKLTRVGKSKLFIKKLIFNKI